MLFTLWRQALIWVKQQSGEQNCSIKLADFIPFLAVNPTVEELVVWIIAMGGRELTPKEAQEWNRKVHWSPVPGEKNAAQNMIFLRTAQRCRTGSRFAKKKPQSEVAVVREIQAVLASVLKILHTQIYM
jgi:hypothetical protein